MVFWIGGLEFWGVKILKKSTHAGFMHFHKTDENTFFETKNPNRQSKPLQKI